jgi:hypothetical protein
VGVSQASGRPEAGGGRWSPSLRKEIAVPKNTLIVLYVVVMIVVVVGVDFLIFRNRFCERLMANVGIVLVFGAFYLRFLKHP